MKIVIVTKDPFPIGMASTNRLISYTKELVKSGNTVKVFCLKPTEKKTRGINNKSIKGNYKGIIYQYTSGTTIWPESGKKRMYKFYLLMKGFFNFILELINEHRNKKIDVLFLQIFDFLSCKITIRLAKLLKIKIISERSEFHDIRFPHFNTNIKKRRKYIKEVFNEFDGMILITKALQLYYNKFINTKCKTIIIPMTVDLSRFDKPKRQGNYIAYCGNLNSKKDGVDILLKSFPKILKKYPNMRLKIIGGGNRVRLQKFEVLADMLSIKNNVDFTGYIKSDNIPQYLINAKALVLARPKSKQAIGGFPTKLGEYLATGNPVVVTKVGEIPMYLEDKENAFLAEPNSIESIEKKILTIMQNYKRALKVGLKGRKVVEEVFNAQVQAKRIEKFLQKII